MLLSHGKGYIYWDVKWVKVELNGYGVQSLMFMDTNFWVVRVTCYKNSMLCRLSGCMICSVNGFVS